MLHAQGRDGTHWNAPIFPLVEISFKVWPRPEAARWVLFIHGFALNSSSQPQQCPPRDWGAEGQILVQPIGTAGPVGTCWYSPGPHGSPAPAQGSRAPAPTSSSPCSPVHWDELLSTVSPAQCNCRTGNNSHCVLRRRRAEGKKGDPAKALFSREEMPEQVHHRGEIPSEGRNS